ncbi:MAG: chromosome segregation protein SMC [Planctomycetes bacterium]|nr:chromosome segregation protein SMC [Planctomycetota bacterium]
MFLKRITVSGFKSFCDRVDFDFGPGVTCIVGPNGCGKSNVVDAFKWVLGEQSARSLRGRQMMDMIFNGSSTRKSSSVAQVDLLFDNADRALPLDQEEITVSRKLYRSGESEYLLNQQGARLKDIRELFLDTGVGVDAYSVIEQGRVDSLLQSNPLDRRVIFEEAAGISRYKVRRREAERKLERTQQNLLRVADVIDELEKRLRSVKLQAGKARSYREYEARLNELRSSFAMAEYHRFTGEIERVTREVDARTDRVTELRTLIDRQEAENVQVTIRLDRLAEEIGTADNHLVEAKSQYAACEERIQAARRRAEEQAALLQRAAERSRADQSRREESLRELASVRDSAAELHRQMQDRHARIDGLNEQDRALARDLTAAQATLEDEKAGIIDLVRRSAQTHNEIIRLNTHRESLVDQKGRLEQRDAVISAELELQLRQKAQLEHRLREVDELIAVETRRLEEKKAEAARVSCLRQQLVDELAGAKERRSALQSRRELLADLERKMEGVGAGVRMLLDRQRRENPPAELACLAGLVADICETDIAHAAIVEAALGEWEQCLVVTDGRAFLRYLATLDGELPGRLTVLCADRLPPIVNEREFSDRPGVVGRAVDLVRVPEAFTHLARHLLGRTIVTETLEDALALARDEVSGHRFVTLGGALVEPDGRVSVGPPDSDAGLISRKSELRDIDVQLSLLVDQIEVLADQLNRTHAEAEHLEGVQQELRTAIYESNTARVEAVAALQGITDAVDRLTSERPLIAGEAALLEHQINEVLEKAEAGGRSLEELDRENREREAKVEAHQQRIDAVVLARRQVQEQQTEARVAAGQLAEKRAAAVERVSAIERALRELDEALAAAERDREQYQARIADAEQTVASGIERLALLAGKIAELDAAAGRLRHERDTLRLDMDARSQAIRNARGELSGVEGQLHEQQMALAETRVRRDELTARVREEMAIDLAERYAHYQHAEQDWTAVEAEIIELRGKMDRLGNVNLDAITELEELEQRHRFLTGQRDDLAEAQRQLQQLIDRLNQESRDRFLSSFEQIRDHFRAMFRKLFGGGRADILLENPENPLECGIEIVAQPPGKDLQVISLMSGGEKSMTAIALLMSIFQSRPAPFAIMDEVDAALDEANNDRFNRIVKEFAAQSQFIIITHSRWTMNIGDRLYGITMQEPGVSTRVGVQLDQAAVA